MRWERGSLRSDMTTGTEPEKAIKLKTLVESQKLTTTSGRHVLISFRNRRIR